jgi:hypothetical protein
MVKLDAGNVLLKPSHRRQVMAWLKRPLRLGEKLGDFGLMVSMSRTGRTYDVRADVRDAKGSFIYHTRQRDWRNALRDLARNVSVRLHDQWLAR